MPRAKILDPSEDDVLVTSVAVVGGNPEHAKPKQFHGDRYRRITPAYIRCVAAYLGVPVYTLTDRMGLGRGFLNNFTRNYSPTRNIGAQRYYQCGFYWAIASLYYAGVLPYGLARLGGIYDAKAEKKETKIVRTLGNGGSKTPKGREDRRKIIANTEWDLSSIDTLSLPED